nr:MAG TPA_asm: hypothetical protein [Caudoviricetes sp.]
MMFAHIMYFRRTKLKFWILKLNLAPHSRGFLY